MKTEQDYRDQGAAGALLDEYEKAVKELQELISSVSDEDLIKIVDTSTKDKDCVSIQSILDHVVRAGYNYVIEIRNWKGEGLDFKTNDTQISASEYIRQLSEMFDYNEALFIDYPDIALEGHSLEEKMKVRWGQSYDVEQIFEHAIVHILRHRRQIERFILRLNN